ncbi:MAG: hypothetical protein QXN55_06945 [Candidatus Nitrosotenuis sp.]
MKTRFLIIVGIVIFVVFVIFTPVIKGPYGTYQLCINSNCANVTNYYSISFKYLCFGANSQLPMTYEVTECVYMK